MVRLKSSILEPSGHAGAAVIAVLSCALAILCCNSAATTAGRNKVAATFASLSQVARGTAPLPRIACAWTHWHKVLHRGAIGKLYQLGRMYRRRHPARCVYLTSTLTCGAPALTGESNGNSESVHLQPTLRTLSRVLDFLRRHSLLPPPPSA
ncbi:MAG: hypothetical protein HKL95_08405 [Phycisphaerae bacterium]|nr:hypothetical protein [Phycisphaerae bacterium]